MVEAIPELLLATLLVALNAFFVAAEFALVRVRRSRLEELSGKGVGAARVTILLVDRLGASLTTVQVGITIASLGVGWLAEDAFSRLLAGVFPALVHGGPSHAIAAGVAFAVITLTHVVAGEMVPKNVALDRTEQVALFVARPLFAFGLVLRPIVWTLTSIAAVVTRAIGRGAVEEPPLSEDELKIILRDSHDEGVITAREARIIQRAFEFADRTAWNVMVPADAVAFLSMSRPVDENVALATRSQHPRLPLCRDGLGSVIGIVHMKDAWPRLSERRDNHAFEAAARPAVWIDPATPQDVVLEKLQHGHAHMAIVGHERSGRMLGVVTIEDVLEALLGDVREARVR